MATSLKRFAWSAVAFLCAAATLPTAAEEPSKQSPGHLLGLGDVMTIVQLRHAKVWYAAKLGNWPLAGYELNQLAASLRQVEQLDPDLPAAGTTDLDRAVDLVAKAILEKSDADFDVAFRLMTDTCNSCHETAGRGFIVIGVPTRFSPYSNQVFEPTGN